MLRIVVELKTDKEKDLADQFKIKCLQRKEDMREAVLEFMAKYVKQPQK